MEIVDYPNYLIYPDGKVSSKRFSQRYLQACVNNSGYYFVNLYKDGKGIPHLIHRLIALHYIPNPENKREVDHINRDKSDNRVENLRWVDRSDNTQNVGLRKDNKLGFKNICYHKKKNGYMYVKKIRGKRYEKYFKRLTDALCYKYIIILKIKSRLL
jgi:hypothetical protein